MSVTVATRETSLIPIAELFAGDEMPAGLGDDDVRAFVLGRLVVVEARRGWQGEHAAWLRVAYWQPRRFREGLVPANPQHPQFSRAWTLPYAERAWAGR